MQQIINSLNKGFLIVITPFKSTWDNFSKPIIGTERSSWQCHDLNLNLKEGKDIQMHIC